MVNQFKKHKYEELDYTADRQRSCYTPGRVYRYKTNRGGARYVIDGDLLLCIKKSGDCCYDFVRLEYNSQTQYSGRPTYQIMNYYLLKEQVMQYGGMEEAFPDMETLSELDLVHVLFSKKVLIPYMATLTKEQQVEMEELWSAEEKAQELRLKKMMI